MSALRSYTRPLYLYFSTKVIYSLFGASIIFINIQYITSNMKACDDKKANWLLHSIQMKIIQS